jgi:L-asparagine oxygenase
MTTAIAHHLSQVVPATQLVSVPAGDPNLVVDCKPYRAQLQQLLATRPQLSLSNPEGFLLEAELLFQSFPEPIRRAVLELKNGMRRYPFALFSGMPTDPKLPPTPLDSRRPRLESPMLGEWLTGAFTRALGEPYGYVQQNEGEIFQNNSPVKLHATAQSGESSATELWFHTDASFHPLPPAFVVLCCLRPDQAREATTSFASVDDILAELTPRQRQVLREPRFLSDGVEYDYDDVNQRGNRMTTVPLVYGSEEYPFLAYDQDVHRPLDPEAAEAMRAMNVAMELVARHVKLDAGDVAIFDNRRSIHKRSPFKAKYDGSDRWCLLTYVAGNQLDASRERRLPGRRRVLDVPAIMSGMP